MEIYAGILADGSYKETSIQCQLFSFWKHVTLMCYVLKHIKSFILISNLYDDVAIVDTSEKKTKIMTFYNSTEEDADRALRFS